MRKSFTRLISLVMLLGLFSSQVLAYAPAGVSADEVWPLDEMTSKAYTKTTDKLMIIYPEDVEASTGSIRLQETVSGLVKAVVSSTSNLISYAKGDTVEVDLSASLKENITYTVIVDAAAFKTVADGTAVSSDTWDFTTGDYTAPTLTTVVPAKDATNVGKTISLVMTFTDANPIELGTAGKVALYKADGNVWDLIEVPSAQASLTGPGELTLNGVRELQDNVDFYVTISEGVVTDDGKTVDGTKNPYAGSDQTWVFSSSDYTAPVMAMGYPKKDNVAATSFDVVVKANEAATAYALISATAPTAATVRSTGESVELTADTEGSVSFSGLSEDTDYTVYVVLDNATVEGTTVSSITVTTAETDAPELDDVDYIYSDNSYDSESVSGNIVGENTDVELNLEYIELYFDEKIQLGAGSITIKRAEDNSVFATIASTEMEVDAEGDNWVKFPVSGLENDTEYYVNIPGTLILDVFDNQYGGISTVTGWQFTSSDDVAPTYTISPAHLSTDVASDTDIVLTFDEVISSYSYSVRVNGSGWSTSSDNDTNGGTYSVITINPTDFPSGAIVQVIVDEEYTVDNDGNPVGTGDVSYTFSVEDTEAPSVDSSTASPLTSATQVIEIKYTEPIYLAGGEELTSANLFTIMTVKKGGASGTNVAVTYEISDDKKTITINPPTAGWESEVIGDYYVAISSDIQDAAENGVSSVFSKLYEVNDLIAETVAISVDGEVISSNLSLNPITITFNEGSTPEDRDFFSYHGEWVAYSAATDMENVFILKEGSANGPDVDFTVTGGPAAFTIDATLEGNKTYYIGVGPSTQDAAGNINEAKFATFSVKYEGTPNVTEKSPADNSNEVATDANFVLTFNTDVELATYVAGDIYYTDGTTDVDVIESEIDVVDNVVTINPTAALSENAAYDIYVSAGVFLNVNATLEGNDEIAIDAWDFMTVDTQVELATIVPDGDMITTGTGVAIDATLKITFDEVMVANAGNIDIRNYDSEVIVERISVTSSQVVVSYPTPTSTEVIITPSAAFGYAVGYYVEVDAGAFVDAQGNPTDEISGRVADDVMTDWTFITDDPALEIVSVTPEDGSDKIAVDAAIVVEFNRFIAAGTGSIGYVEGDGDQYQVYPIGSSNITIDGKTLTITHTDKDYPADEYIYLYIEQGAITVDGAVSNEIYLVDYNTTENYSFNTGDVNPPVPTFDPADFSSSSPVYVDLDTDITITFDEDIYNSATGVSFTNGGIVSSGIFAISDGSSVPFAGSVSGRTVVLSPSDALAEYTEYTVSIDEDGSVTIVDDQDQTTPDTEISFWTKDLTAPAVTAFTLSGGAKMFSVPAVTVTDASGNENKFYYLVREKSDVAAPTVAEIIAANMPKDASSGTVTGFNVMGLAASTTYELYYVVDDTFGNTSAVAKVEASTDDTIAPLFVSSDPATEAVDVDIDGGDVVITLTFNEAVVVGTSGSILLREQGTQSLSATYDYSVLAVGDTDEELVLTLTGLPTDADVIDFYVEIGAATVEDEAGNEFAGIYGANAIYFSTEDNLIPTIALDGLSTLASNANITLKASEDVQAGTGTAILYYGSTNAEDAIEVFNASDVTFDGTMITIDPTDDLELDLEGDYSPDYYLVLNADFALDMSSNENGNASTTISFDVDENIAPYVTSPHPTNDSPINKSSLESYWYDFDFSEAIYYEYNGVLTSILYLPEAFVIAEGLVEYTDSEGNLIPLDLDQCCSDDIVWELASGTELEHNSSYTVTIKGFKDITGLEMTEWSYTWETTDGAVPTAIFDPADDTEDVNENTVMTITFSEAVYNRIVYDDGTFFVQYDDVTIDDYVYVSAWEPEDGSYSPEFDATIVGDSLITITLTEPLLSSSEVDFGYNDDDDFVDADNQDVDGDDYARFYVRDYVLPEVEEAWSSPSTNDVGVALNAPIVIDFSEEVLISTGSVVIRNEDGTIFESVSGDGLSYSLGEDDEIVVAHAPFVADAAYFVEVQANVVTDLAGNANEAWGDAFTMVFTTGDSFPVSVTELSPLGDNQPTLVDFEISFNKSISDNAAGLYGYYLAVYKADGTAVYQIDASDASILGNVARFRDVVLEADQAYYARLEAGAYVDGSGNLSVGIMDDTWTFSTLANIAPEVVELSPADNSANVSTGAAFEMTFDRDIALGAGEIAIRYSLDGTLFEAVDVTTATVEGAVLTFSLSQAMEDLTSYYVIVPEGAITNTEITADPFAGILNTFTWNFSTGTDTSAPVVESLSPDAETLADNHPTFIMVMNEDVELTTAGGSIHVIPAGETVATLDIVITAEMISASTITIDYTTASGLDKDTEYYVTVDAAAIQDMSGNEFDGISDETEWTFTTGADFATGTEDPVNDSLEFKVYPNPFADIVKVDNADQLSRIIITNVAGQRVKDIVNPSNVISTGELRSGIYFITLVEGDVVVKTERIVKR